MLENLDAGGTKTKYRITEETAERYTISELCKFFGVSRSGYNAFLKRKDTDLDESMKTLIMKVYTKDDGKYGYRQIQMNLLQDHKEMVNHKKVLRLMQEMGMRSRIRVKRRQNYPSVRRRSCCGQSATA